MKKNYIYVLGVIFLLSTACTKEETIVHNKYRGERASSNILKFEDNQEFIEAVNYVKSCDFSELKRWEDENNFKSFGRVCEELYASIDFNKFTNQSDFFDLVNEYSEYLQLIPIGDEEYTLETKVDDNPYRYFLNKDMIFQIGSVVYKLVDSELIASPAGNIENLKKLTVSNLDFHLKDTSKYLQVTQTKRLNCDYVNTKDVGNNVGTYRLAGDTVGNNATKLVIQIYTANIMDQWTYEEIGTLLRAHYLVRPYKKTLGIWYFCTRTISCNIRLRLDWKDSSGNWDYQICTYTNSGTFDSKLEGDVYSNYVSFGYFYNPTAHFGGIDSWGRTPDTDKAEIKLNTGVCY
jgi:ribosome-associated toxin RatA of RatAB toxin-antitoxin module